MFNLKTTRKKPFLNPMLSQKSIAEWPDCRVNLARPWQQWRKVWSDMSAIFRRGTVTEEGGDFFLCVRPWPCRSIVWIFIIFCYIKASFVPASNSPKKATVMWKVSKWSVIKWEMSLTTVSEHYKYTTPFYSLPCVSWLYCNYKFSKQLEHLRNCTESEI